LPMDPPCSAGCLFVVTLSVRGTPVNWAFGLNW
jgi:hypothetical protein